MALQLAEDSEPGKSNSANQERQCPGNHGQCSSRSIFEERRGCRDVGQVGRLQELRCRAVFGEPDEDERTKQREDELSTEDDPETSNSAHKHCVQAACNHVVRRQPLLGPRDLDDRPNGKGQRHGRPVDQQQLPWDAPLIEKGQVGQRSEDENVDPDGEDVASKGAMRSSCPEIEDCLRIHGQRILSAASLNPVDLNPALAHGPSPFGTSQAGNPGRIRTGTNQPRRARAGRTLSRKEGGSPGRIRTADISLAGRAQGALLVDGEVVAPGGFEPPISALRGLRPSPLDDGATFWWAALGLNQ